MLIITYSPAIYSNHSISQLECNKSQRDCLRAAIVYIYIYISNLFVKQNHLFHNAMVWLVERKKKKNATNIYGKANLIHCKSNWSLSFEYHKPMIEDLKTLKLYNTNLLRYQSFNIFLCVVIGVDFLLRSQIYWCICTYYMKHR